MPYLFPALRLAGASAVVGAIVAEISTGIRGGIGRLVIEYSREATSDPAKVYTAIIGAAAARPAVAGLVALLDLALTRYRRPRRTDEAAAAPAGDSRVRLWARASTAFRGRRGTALDGVDLTVDSRRVRVADRPVRLRQVARCCG